jgi:hypothetical protein
MFLTMNRSLSRFQMAFLSSLSLQRVFIVGLSENGPQKRDHAWFLCTEEYFNVKRFLQKMAVFYKFFPLKIRAHQAALQDACHETLSRHPGRHDRSSWDIRRQRGLKSPLSGRFTLPARRSAETGDRGCGLAFLSLIG